MLRTRRILEKNGAKPFFHGGLWAFERPSRPLRRSETINLTKDSEERINVPLYWHFVPFFGPRTAKKNQGRRQKRRPDLCHLAMTYNV
jgi:hypothetical protein